MRDEKLNDRRNEKGGGNSWNREFFSSTPCVEVETIVLLDACVIMALEQAGNELICSDVTVLFVRRCDALNVSLSDFVEAW